MLTWGPTWGPLPLKQIQHNTKQLVQHKHNTTQTKRWQGSSKHKMWNLCSIARHCFEPQHSFPVNLKEPRFTGKVSFGQIFVWIEVSATLILTETVFVHLFTCTGRSSLGLASAPNVFLCVFLCYCVRCSGWGLESTPSVCDHVLVCVHVFLCSLHWLRFGKCTRSVCWFVPKPCALILAPLCA